jgi:tetratricopeptide (TPR) repeat protein
MCVFLGRPEEAIQRLNRALRLSPNDSQIFNIHTGMATAHFFAARYEEASSLAEMALREKPDFTLAAYVSAATNALAGRLAEAEKAMAFVRQQNPTFRLTNLQNLYPFRRPEDIAKWQEGLRLAGLPE